MPSLYNLELSEVETKAQGVHKPETNLLEMNDNPKETWCRCASALNPRSISCLKGTKSFELERIGHNFITLTIHSEENWSTEKPFTQKSFSYNNLRVEREQLP